MHGFSSTDQGIKLASRMDYLSVLKSDGGHKNVASQRWDGAMHGSYKPSLEASLKFSFDVRR